MKKNLLFISLLFFLFSCKSTNTTDQDKFTWDFSTPKTFTYSFEQTIEGTNKMGEDIPSDKIYVEGVGQLNVAVKENLLADLSLLDMDVKMIMFDRDGEARDTMSQKAPPLVLQGMNAKGSFESSPSADILFDIIFPLPLTDIEIGDQEKLPMQMPFNANGSPLVCKGSNTLTFVEMKNFEGHECAVFKGEIDVSDLEVPTQLSGEYACKAIGEASYYFDIKNGYYVGADIQLRMETLMNTEAQDANGFGTWYIEMKSNNLYKIRLLETPN